MLDLAHIGERIRECRKKKMMTIRVLGEYTGLSAGYLSMLEQIRTLDKHRLRERAGQITPEDQRRVNQALDVSLGLDSY